MIPDNDDMRFLEKITNATAMLVARQLDNFLRDRPNASGAEVMDHLQRLGQPAFRFVKARRAGYYNAFPVSADGLAWIADVLVDRTTVLRADDDPGADPRVRALLNQVDAGRLVAAAQIALRHVELDEIEDAVLNPHSKERAFQRRLERAPWIFGGEYVSRSDVRRPARGTEVDLPLLRPDGVLHVVELKVANVRVVKRHRSALVPTAEFHDAVAQVVNYLRAFDEQRERVRDLHGVDARRAGGTVVIGHPTFDSEATEAEINEALRVYTSHLSRIDVMTYKQLLDGARRALDLAGSSD